MATCVDLFDNLKALNISDIARSSMIATSEDYAVTNRAQMMQGKDAQGKKIAPRYSRMKYARFKQARNPQPGLGVPDLRLTGSFQDKLKMSVKSDTIEVDSSDSKTPDLLAKYGETVFGLSDDSKSDYIENSLLPETCQEIEKLTGLEFT